MALTKRTYVDGETIITAQNLNDIQDEVRGNIRNVSYNTTSGKLQKTTNSGTTSDVVTVDETPTANSKNPVQSGGVYTQINTINDAFGDYLYMGVSNAITLNDGTDYNNLTIGAYYIGSRAKASTMLHCPLPYYGHKLIVGYTLSSSIQHQIAIPNYSTVPYIFVRTSTASSTTGVVTWSPWRSIVPLRITDTVSAGTASQTFTHHGVISDQIAKLAYISNPTAVGSDIAITTNDESVTITGTFYEPVDITYDVQ